MELELRCSLCKVFFNEQQNIPLVLPLCGDTLCWSCLAKEVDDTSPRSFNCPICNARYEVQNPSTLQISESYPKNQFILSLLSKGEGPKSHNICERHNLARKFVCFSETCDRKVPFCESCRSESHPNCANPFIVKQENLGQVMNFDSIASDSQAMMTHFATELNMEIDRLKQGAKYALDTHYIKIQEDMEELRELGFPNARHILSLLNVSLDPQTGGLHFRLKALDEAHELVQHLKRRITAIFSDFSGEDTGKNGDEQNAKVAQIDLQASSIQHNLRHKLIRPQTNTNPSNLMAIERDKIQPVSINSGAYHKSHNESSIDHQHYVHSERHFTEKHTLTAKRDLAPALVADSHKLKETKSSSGQPILESNMAVTSELKPFIEDIKSYFGERRNFELLFKHRIDLSEYVRPLLDTVKLFLVKYIKRVGTRSQDSRNRWKHIWSLIFSKEDFPEIFESPILRNNPIYIVIRKNSKGKLIYKVFDLFSYDMQVYLNKCLEK